MKKVFVLAGMVLLSFAVEAVTVDWKSGEEAVTGYQGAGYYQEKLTTPGATTTNPLVTSAMVFSTSQTVSSNIFMLGNGNLSESWSAIILNLQADGSLQGWRKDNAEGGTNMGLSTMTKVSTEGSNVLAMTFDTSNRKVSVFLNGTEIGSYTSPNTEGIFKWKMNTVSMGYGTDGKPASLISNGYMTVEGFYSTTAAVSGADMMALVPEPTALALLALGVAGIALRRRMA